MDGAGHGKGPDNCSRWGCSIEGRIVKTNDKGSGSVMLVQVGYAFTDLGIHAGDKASKSGVPS